MTRIILSTGNIVTSGPSILRTPGDSRTNVELTTSLRSSIVTAKEDFPTTSPPSPETPLQTLPVTGNVLPSWVQLEDEKLFVPRVHWPGAGLQEDYSRYDVTVKLFFLPGSSVEERVDYIAEALDLLKRELGEGTIGLLIASFPGLSLDGDCEWKADKLNATQGDDEAEVATWKILEQLFTSGKVQRLGIAEFGSEKLAGLLSKVEVRPAVDQISIRNCCKAPPPLVQLASKENIELLAHKDDADALPSGTLRELLGQVDGGAGLLADVESEEGLHGDLLPRWVVKYTAVVRDRGVIENKGYFAAADLVNA